MVRRRGWAGGRRKLIYSRSAAGAPIISPIGPAASPAAAASGIAPANRHSPRFHAPRGNALPTTLRVPRFDAERQRSGFPRERGNQIRIRMNANETSNNAGYQLATRIAAVAAVVAMSVCALLLYDYTQRLRRIHSILPPTRRSATRSTSTQPTSH